MGDRRPRLPIRNVPILGGEDRATEEAARRAADKLLQEITAATAEPLPAPRSERIEHAVAAVPPAVDLRSTDSKVKIDPAVIAEVLPKGNPGDVTIPPNRPLVWTPPTEAEYAASLAGSATEGDGTDLSSGLQVEPKRNRSMWTATLSIPRAVITWIRRLASRSRNRG